MKKIFTLLAVAAMAMSSHAELTYLEVTPKTADGAVEKFAAGDVVFDCDVLTAKTVNAAATGANEYTYNYALTTSDGDLGTETVTPAFPYWFELRSKAPTADAPFEPTKDGDTRSALLVELKQAATLYTFVRTGNNKHINLYDASATVVANTSEGWYTDPGSSSNAFFTTIWKDVPAGTYLITEAGGTGRLSGMAYEISETNLVEVAAEENAPVEYFNLQGVRVAEPANGLFIRRQGNKVTKVIL